MAEPKTSARHVITNQRRARALQMRAAGMTYEQIFQAGLGYKSRANAVQDVQRALALAIAEPAADLRHLELMRLDMLWQKALAVMSRKHITVSHGRVVEVAGKPLADDMPILAAIRELRQLSESRRKLLGLDAPTKVEVITDDALDAEIRRLSAELNERAAASENTALEGVEAAEG